MSVAISLLVITIVVTISCLIKCYTKADFCYDRGQRTIDMGVSDSVVARIQRSGTPSRQMRRFMLGPPSNNRSITLFKIEHRNRPSSNDSNSNNITEFPPPPPYSSTNVPPSYTPTDDAPPSYSELDN